jgi:hypothetical protein
MRSFQQSRGPTASGRVPADRAKPAGASALQRRADTAPRIASLQQWQAAATAASYQTAATAMQRIADETALQRQLEDEELMQGRFVEPVQRQLEEEEPLQGRLAAPVQRAEGSAAQGLPGPLRSGVEALSGRDMSDVRVHYGSARPATVAAHAYAQGDDIHLAPGQERHLPHEAWHVVQQREGRVRPTGTVAGQALNDDPGLEQEADRMGARALGLDNQER